MEMKKLISTLLAAAGITASCLAQNKVKVVAPEEFQSLVKADTTACVLDVRTAEEYAEGHLKGAANIDWLQEEAFIKSAAKLGNDKTYYVYCRSGRRSNSAATKMQALGLKVIDMKGGFLAWTEAGLPVEK